MFAILLLYAVFNLQTKCNFMGFFHSWVCYQFWLNMVYCALYLVRKCMQQVRVASALRHGLGAGADR